MNINLQGYLASRVANASREELVAFVRRPMHLVLVRLATEELARRQEWMVGDEDQDSNILRFDCLTNSKEQAII